MKARFDIVDPTIGRVVLSSLFNAPPHGVSGGQVRGILTDLNECKRKLEKRFGEGRVHLSLDNYEASVFWYLVLFRPVLFFENHPIFGSRKVNVYDILRSKGGPRELAASDLGLQYDRARNWLRLFWNEAMTGVLAGLDKCPSWADILQTHEKREGSKAPWTFWRACAESHSWVIPISWLEGMRYRREIRHARDVYDNLTVLNLEGIEMIKLEGHGKGVDVSLMTTKNIRFVHHYVDADPREYKNMLNIERRVMRDRIKEEKQRLHKEYMRNKRTKEKLANRQTNERKEEVHNAWWYASQLIAQIIKLLRIHGFKGRRIKYLDDQTCAERYRIVENSLSDSSRSVITENTYQRLCDRLNELTKVLDDPIVPHSFRMWLGLKSLIVVRRKS